MNHIAITLQELKRCEYTRAASAGLLGFLLGLTLSGYVYYLSIQPTPIEIALRDRIIEHGCKLPHQDGGITQFMRLNGRLDCYKMM